MEFNWNLQGLPGPFLDMRTTSQCAVVIAGYRHQGRCRRHPASLSGTGAFWYRTGPPPPPPIPVPDWLRHQHIYRPELDLTDVRQSRYRIINGRHGHGKEVGIELTMATGLCKELKDGWLVVLRDSEMLRAENSLFHVERSLEITGDELRMAFCA
jgi:hypothetical protein